MVLENVLATIPAWIAVKDISDDYRYLLWNRKAEELTGIKTDDIVGKRDYDFPILKCDAENFRENSRKAAEHGGYLHIPRYDWMLPNGHKIILEGHISHIKAGTQNLEIAMCHDITALSEIQTVEQEKLLLINAIDIPVILFDDQHTLLQANQAAKAMSGATDTELHEQPCYRLFCHCDGYPESCPVEKTLTDQKSHRTSQCIAGHDYLEISEPIIAHDQLKYVLYYLLDVTERNAAQRKMNELIADAKNASTRTFAFMTSLIFNLRGAANEMIGGAELLSRNLPESEEDREILDSVKAAENEIFGLLDNTQDFIRFETGLMNETASAKLIPGLFFNELKKYVPRTISLTCDIANMPTLSVSADMLKNILWNWINCIGSEKRPVRLKAEFVDGKRLEIRLESQHAEKIFQANVNSPGLHLAKLFVDKLGGEVESGSDFLKLILPRVERIF